MSRSAFDYINFMVTLIGTVLGGIGIYLTINNPNDLSMLQYLLIVFCILFFVLFLTFLRKNAKNQRYKVAYREINKAFAIINSLDGNDEKLVKLTDCLTMLGLFCTELSEAFQIITSAKCAVCVKLFEKSSNNDVCVITLCRDKESMQDKYRVSPDDDKTIHYLNDNTDFKEIFENVDTKEEQHKHFFCNCLPFRDFYSNTRFDNQTYPPKCNIPFAKELVRYFKWPLPYKSTISVPIMLIKNKEVIDGKIAGFLCVDSTKMYVFSKYDIDIMKGVSDGIYTTLRKINEIHFGNVHKTVVKSPKRKNT